MTGSRTDGDWPLSEEQLDARRSNRRVLLVILAFVVGLGLVPLAAILIRNLS